MDSSHKAYHDDWVFANGSNVHVANHRGWFTSYTAFRTYATDIIGNKLQIEGIGTVTLPVMTHPSRTSQNYQRTLILRDTLYAPTAICNILGGNILQEFEFSLGGREVGKLIDRQTSACRAIIDHAVLFRLRLQGQSAEQTSLPSNEAIMIRANWPSSERLRWESYRNEPAINTIQSSGHSTPASPSQSNPPYTAEEKRWLKEHFGSEFHFLRAYNLRIYEDNDRAEGRELVRSFIQQEREESLLTTGLALSDNATQNGPAPTRNGSDLSDDDSD